MNKFTWSGSNKSAVDYDVNALDVSDGRALYEEAAELRRKLIDDLANLCPNMMSHVMNYSSYDDITEDMIQSSLRSVTQSNQAVPVLVGSALKSKGIQPLLNAVVDYLPGPQDHPCSKALGSDKELCAFAFKTIHEKERDAVTFLRLFSGALRHSSSVYNLTQSNNERVGRLYTILANQLVDTNSVQPGKYTPVSALY